MLKKMREGFIVLSLLLCALTPAAAQVSVGVGIGHPSVSIGVSVPVYPELVVVPNYPVYYAPRLRANYFFYDGMYWVYEGDTWYASTWYNGPWGVVHRDVVPAFVLRVPVRYYRAPPAYFVGLRADVAPLWGVHWGRDWEVRRAGWEVWDRRVVYARAPLPLYQRQYVGARYPRAVDQQVNIHITNYNHHPRDTVVRAHFKEQVAKAPPEARRRFEEREAAQAKREAAQAKKEATAKSAPAQARREGKREESAKSAAPGQVKREEGAKSAKEFAPGQVKREEGAKSAKEFAPGQQGKGAPAARDDDRKGQARDDRKGQARDDDRKGKARDDDRKGKGGDDDRKGKARDDDRKGKARDDDRKGRDK